MGGAQYNDVGGGGNYRCMVNDAEYNSDNTVSVTGFMAGTEYRTFSYSVFLNSASEQNAPCSVCYAKTRSSVIMIPGKRSCPSNEWTLEYKGMLCVSFVMVDCF